MNGCDHRIKEFILPADGRSLIVDTSAGLELGALPGLEDFAAGVGLILRLADGLVCSPGQLRRLSGVTRQAAGLLVRMDWTNTVRAAGPESVPFVLPPSKTTWVPVLTPQDALDLGAAAMVSTFLLGYEEEIDAACLRTTVQWALGGKEIGMPLVVEVLTSGPRVSLPDKAIELGASYALEGGADVIVLPYPGHKSLETVAAFVSVPWLVKPTSLASAASELQVALDSGAAGLWLDHRLFAAADPAAYLATLTGQLHAVEAV